MTKIVLYPADIYQVVDKSLISEMDKLILNMLYMPVIGNNAVSLYLKLQSETRNIIVSPELTHHHLMATMQLKLEDIVIAREKLEAAGLLKTYLKKDNINHYVYLIFSVLFRTLFGINFFDFQLVS